MKKYTALTLTLISVLGLIWVGFVFARMRFTSNSLPPEAPANAQVLKEGQEATTHLRSLSAMLSWLEQAKMAAIEAPLAQGPTEAQDKINKMRNPSGLASNKPKAAPAISMIYMSNDMKLAVIDGKQYEVGDRLSNGGSIVEIAMDKVVYILKGKQQVMKTPPNQVVGSTAKVAATAE